MCEVAAVKVGDRIESDGYYATVRYVGHLTLNQSTSSKAKDALWVGVEWDESSRGKHDGTYAGVKYFDTSYPTSGSFLRIEKCNIGVSFLTALASRYGIENEGLANLDDMYVCGKNQQTTVTAVGLDQVMQKQSCFSELRAVGLRGMYVRDAGIPGEIAPNAARVTELDLSLNLVADWAEVATIASQMPCLTSLNVSENRLRLLTDTNGADELFKRVKTLCINRMAYSWVEVSHCISLFASLEELHVCYNKISCISNIPGGAFDRLSLLNVEGNTISNWSALLDVGRSPLLKTLIVNDCGLVSISFPGNRHSKTEYFPALESVSISENLIADWSSIDELNRLQSLRNLRFARNPISLAISSESARHLAIAKIAGLKSCNGAKIYRTERYGAELDYLRVFGPAWKAAGGSASGGIPSAEFIELHPRYLDLIRIHGAAEDAEMAQPQTSALKNNLVTVQIVTSHNNQPLVRKLPVKMTVQKLRALIQRTYHISDPSSIQLLYILPHKDGENNGDTRVLNDIANLEGVRSFIELDNDLRELGFYSIENDGVVCAKW